jgi:glycogen operon protein
MLLAGDEFGNSQGGNNNAYAQDNETGWLDWSGLEEDPGFTEKVRELVQLRRRLPLLRQARYVHGRMPSGQGWYDITWLHPDGRPMQQEDWSNGQQISLLFSRHEEQHEDSPVTHAIAILFNASARAVAFALPAGLSAEWVLRFFSDAMPPAQIGDGKWQLGAQSMVLATLEQDRK